MLGTRPLETRLATALTCHMRVRTQEETDWERIVLLYDALKQITLWPRRKSGRRA